jgi:hypothetical protein
MYDIFITMDQIQITEYLAKKVFNGELTSGYYIMLKNKQIYLYGIYGKLVESYKISSEDAFVYFTFMNCHKRGSYNHPVAYLFPLIDVYSINRITESYLAKLGFYSPNYSVYPATGLKYFGAMRLFSDRLVIELTDIDTMATNTGLRKIVTDVLGKGILTQKEISWDQGEKIDNKLYRQKLFAGHNSNKIREIIYDYYINHDTSLAKEVLAIAKAYNRVFEPYRVVYDTTTRQQVLM